MAGVDRDAPKQNGHVASNVPVDMDRAEGACNVAGRLAFSDVHVVANACPVLLRSGECRHGGSEKERGGEEQSVHENLVELVYGGECFIDRLS